MIGHHKGRTVFFVVLLFTVFLEGSSFPQVTRTLPEKVPPKRTSQIQDGFGINSDLPRDPYLPWNRWWWTRGTGGVGRANRRRGRGRRPGTMRREARKLTA